MLQHMTGFPSFLRLNHIPLYVLHLVYPVSQQWTLGLFQPFGYYDAMNMGVQDPAPIPLGIHPEAQLPDHMVIV